MPNMLDLVKYWSIITTKSGNPAYDIILSEEICKQILKIYQYWVLTGIEFKSSGIRVNPVHFQEQEIIC